ncbi:DUF7284 family protein [Haloarchaeobius litoreus]|uniref:Uncharacterized protein n=1 Tax=Haloarchaeobius litoreus TaxID=755306 RepID=A0ABD6DFM7_9EURY|nr:hypothetical protein [Haloarchaeobius litoreus]
MTRLGHRYGRAVSTVLDVAVCLLFVTASVGVLATVERPVPDDSQTADRAASLLGTTTVTVHYAATDPNTDGEDPGAVACRPADAARPDACRTAHGTVAGLLARAAVADVVDDESAGRSPFERGVRNATRQRLAGVHSSWQVVVTWRAYPDAPLAGRVVVGTEPPPEIDVHTATLRVPVADGATTSAQGDGEPQTVAAVARRAASTTVAGLFPPEPTRLALAGGPPLDRRTAGRYRRTAAALGVGLDGAVADGSVRRANSILVEALAARYASDLGARTDDPAAAAELVSVETATVTVRTWSV